MDLKAINKLNAQLAVIANVLRLVRDKFGEFVSDFEINSDDRQYNGVYNIYAMDVQPFINRALALLNLDFLNIDATMPYVIVIYSKYRAKVLPEIEHYTIYSKYRAKNRNNLAICCK